MIVHLPFALAGRDPAQTVLSCSKVGMPSAMEEFFQAYYIIAIHLHIVFLQVIAFAWVCLKADSQEQMIVHKRKLCICHLPWGLLSGCTVWGCPRLSWLHVLSNAWHLSSTIGPSWGLLSWWCCQGVPLAVILSGAGARRGMMMGSMMGTGGGCDEI